jgi:type VI secretion system protein ImpF
MREPRTIEGALAPLFDRLSAKDAGAREDAASRILDRKALRRSVEQDLLRLLNTRSAPEGEAHPRAAGTVLDYGIPDISWVTPTSEQDLQRLAIMIARKVAAHEPRLVNVRATALSSAAPRGVTVTLSATLRAGSLSEPVTFPLAIDRQTVKAEPT